MRTRSVKRAKQEREYLKLRKEFLEENPYCVPHKDFMQKVPATTIHHQKGRIGTLLTDTKYFLPCCMECHHEIEENPAWAKEMGYSLSRLSKEVSELKKV